MHRRPSRRALLQELARKTDQIMSQQETVDTATKAIQPSITALNTAVTGIAGRIAALEAKVEPPADLTGLNQAASDLATAADAVAALGTQQTKARTPRKM